ncbi:MAG: glycine betaine/L-proline ABC transporter ATP-binding protein [Methanoculleus sp.]|uniref:quaternary amine ABC transporter ATP-binding protein n=1 Tax=Methanoculleus sp. UBA430 TaxID=1915511 RepID=UPI0025F364D0|nr:MULTISPECIES: glycine betaine/L-proline ABC transporter ATP-binding protein [unclassified Methanoculleus]MDD2253629.1 glycine betaine/L-proline ABC transporter ATP-binding protein [Methanoculleus sp.]MDD2787446.1 glycine betaine/L-proline ABC transporter ATP-binding protein [Methanoculleus sp.]MDD3216215.1 glycine betaine/L-proline ABC transporter ATP-binding protein [Methanoculleus sp.]MDD4314116.1 glycine betaine/L-proline ABC transporter ATP-binding protein [Methanoculleus sp.]MDD4470489
MSVKGLTKVFGQDPGKALELHRSGRSKQEIYKETGSTLALDNVSFEVMPGETFVLMGLSGSGKSTLLRCINRLIDPTEGEIRIDGEDVVRMNREELQATRRRKLGMIFQSFALLPHRTVLDNVAFGLEIQGIPADERHKKAEEVLQMVGLGGYGASMPGELSGGMKQRVGLARALTSDPDILLMDEAFSALDPLIRRDMQDELLEIQQRLGKTIVFVTHDLDEALKLGDRIALMKDGAIVQIGTPEEILTNPENAYVEKFVADVDLTRVLSASDVMRHPEPVAQCTAGPRVALHLMEEHDIPGIFVVTRQRLLRGRVTLDDAVEAVKKGKAMAEILITDIPVVAPDASLSDIISLIVGSPYPVAVADDTGRLKGVISRGAILAALARKGEDINATA